MLHGFGIHDNLGNLKKLAFKGKSFFRPRLADNSEAFLHDFMGLLVIDVKTFINATVRMTAASSKIHPPVAQEIEHCRLFRKVHRVVNRQRIDSDAES